MTSWSSPRSWVQPGWPKGGARQGVWGTHGEAREALGAVSGRAVFPLRRADQVLSLGIAPARDGTPRGFISPGGSPLPRTAPRVPRLWSGRSTVTTRTTVTAATVVPLDTEGTSTCGGRTFPDTAPGTLRPHMHALPGRGPGLGPWLTGPAGHHPYLGPEPLGPPLTLSPISPGSPGGPAGPGAPLEP